MLATPVRSSSTLILTLTLSVCVCLSVNPINPNPNTRPNYKFTPHGRPVAGKPVAAGTFVKDTSSASRLLLDGASHRMAPPVPPCSVVCVLPGTGWMCSVACVLPGTGWSCSVVCVLPGLTVERGEQVGL